MFILWYRVQRKKFNIDPIDYASIDKIEFWVVEDDEPPFLDHEEIENALYEEEPIQLKKGLLAMYKEVNL